MAIERRLSGVAVSPRSGRGRARVVGPVGEGEAVPLRADDVRTELLRFDTALAKSRDQLEHMRGRSSNPEADNVVSAQLEMLADPTFVRSVLQRVKGEHWSAVRAVDHVIGQLARRFAEMSDAYMRAREADVQDVGSRIRRNLLGRDPNELYGIDAGAILVARDLAPSTVVQLEHVAIGGIVMEGGAATSHAAIMARGMGIPCLVGVAGLLAAVGNGDLLILDHRSGEVVVDPSEATLEAIAPVLAAQAPPEERPAQEAGERSELVTQDGVRVHLRANVSLGAEVRSLRAFGAEGVGLFRTEYLFMGKPRPPPFKAQLRTYTRAVQDAAGELVTFRTIDVGGDKDIPYFGRLREPNPAMGLRSIRLCMREEATFRIQLRAILRASAEGPVHLMYPMIASLEDLERANRILSEVASDLVASNEPFDPDLRAGMMVEVPAAALSARLFAPRVAFFSIGTNDLVQFLMAADRMNPEVSEYLSGVPPALIDLIRTVVAAARAAGIPVSCCGELPAEPVGFTILLGLGIRDFSMNLFAVPRIRQLAARLDTRELEKLVSGLSEASGAGEVRHAVESYLVERGLPVV